MTSNCGLRSQYQAELAADKLGAPVLTSALMQAAPVQAMLSPVCKVGTHTISRETLNAAHLESVGVPPGTPVWGVRQGCDFQCIILNNRAEPDLVWAGRDVTEASPAFVVAYPELNARTYPLAGTRCARRLGFPSFRSSDCGNAPTFGQVPGFPTGRHLRPHGHARPVSGNPGLAGRHGLDGWAWIVPSFGRTGRNTTRTG